jgi:uncharacterized protein (TIGR04255 family)
VLSGLFFAATPQKNKPHQLVQPGSIELEDVLEWVNEAHKRVGETFEACITNSLREKFGKERTEP